MIRGAAMLLVLALAGTAVGWTARGVVERRDGAQEIEAAAPVEQAVRPSPDEAPIGARAALVGSPPALDNAPLRSPDMQATYAPPSSPTEFLERLDEIAGLARGGDTDAAMTMWRFLSRCGGASLPSVERVQEQFENQREYNPAEAERRRAAALDVIEMCRHVGWQPLDTLGWLEYALATGNEQAALAATRVPGTFSKQEQIRHAERLARVIAAGAAALDQRLAQGDTRALHALANAHQNGALPYDPVRIFAYRYAHTLIPAAPNEWRPDVERLGKDLTPEQIEEGLRLGGEIFEACCRTE